MLELKLVGDSTEPVSDYLHWIFDGLEGFTYAPVLDRSTGQFTQRWFNWPVEAELMRDWILRNQANETYVAPAVFSEPTLSKPTFKASNVVWTEFDGNTPALENLGDIPAPSLQVQSSSENFQHWYWKLSTPITNVSELEGINRSITYALGADSSSWDATQILRPTGTTNHKRNLGVSLIFASNESYNSSLFSAIKFVEVPLRTFELSSIPDVSEVILKYSFTQELIELFRTKEFPVGERSSNLMRLGYCLAEVGMTDAEMFSVLRNADDRWKKFAGRKDRDQRLVDLIAKARVKYPNAVDIPEDFIPLLGMQTFLDSEIEIEWLIPGLLQSLGYMMVTGPAGVGKTQFSLQVAIHLALGRPFIGLDIQRSMRVLFMSLEMGHADLKFFVSMMVAGYSDEDRAILEQNLILAPLGEPFYLDDKVGQDKFEQVLSVVRPELFMWDSVGSATGAQLSDESTVKKIMDFNDRIRKRYSVASWYIHHNRKATVDNKRPNKQSDVYGNQYLVNRATSVYCLWPAGTSIEVIPLKKRLVKLEEPWHIVRNETDLSFSLKRPVGGLTTNNAPSPLTDNSNSTGEMFGDM